MFFWLIHGHTSSNSHIVRTLNRCSGSHRTFLDFLSRNAVISWVNFSMLADWNFSDEHFFTWDETSTWDSRLFKRLRRLSCGFVTSKAQNSNLYQKWEYFVPNSCNFHFVAFNWSLIVKSFKDKSRNRPFGMKWVDFMFNRLMSLNLHGIVLGIGHSRNA